MLEILAGMLRTAAPSLLAAMGGVVFEKAGVFTIAHEGIMLFGAFFGVLGVYLTASPLMGVAFALTAGAVCGLLYIWLTERLSANATIVSIGINTLAIGATTYMMKMIFGDAGTVGNPRIIGLPRISIPLFDRVPFLDKVLNNHTALVYVSLLLVAALHFLLFHTHLGISLRAVGEKPEAAAAAGIPVYRYRLAASVFAGMLCGLAGVHLSLGYVKMFTENITAGRGFFAYTAVVFGHANPFAAALASFVFGLAEVVTFRVQNLNLPGPLVLTIPYLVTLAVLILRNLRLKKPAAHKPNPAATNN